MPRRSNHPEPAFTLVELIIVMAVLTTLLAIAAPTLSRSFRQRHLNEEATRLLALTEYGREEAVSRGVPAVVWIAPDQGLYGVETADGYKANPIREKQYALNPDLHFDVVKSHLMPDGRLQAVQFEPDGSPDTSAIDSVRIVDRFKASVLLELTKDKWSYEIAKEGANANRR